MRDFVRYSLATALCGALVSSTALAQTAQNRARLSAAPGHQVIVHPRPSYLTGGTGASFGSRQGYVLDTLKPPQRDTIQGTFVGMRGLDRLPNQFSLPQANRPLLIVSWPGSNEPLFSWY
jgi:hypothetical protein